MSEMPALDTSTVPPSMLDETVQPVPQTQSTGEPEHQEKSQKNLATNVIVDAMLVRCEQAL